ncbi:hypothetical protein CRG98_015065 [Punica granatum]|uniref:Retrotransposon gag domain-containing protein n=1 Tax=Punica granatum TaxID=22663 RepID=A0A2I0K7I8_PUNGR|nr:hypothetical protein CRG98_015065 [Punica granatum]
MRLRFECAQQQIQMFDGTLKEAYYSHLMGHKSTFSEMIMAGKQVDLGIKLGSQSRAPGISTIFNELNTCATCHFHIRSANRALPVSTSRSAGLLFGPTSPTSISPTTNCSSLHSCSSSSPIIQTPGFESSSASTAVPASQSQKGGVSQSQQHKQFTPLPAPLSHIYRQPLAGNKIRTIAPNLDFDSAVQDQSRHYEYHQGVPGHTTDNCWKLRERIQQMIDVKQLTFNAVKPPNMQVNPLPDHGSSSGPTISMISVCNMWEYETEQEGPAPFVIKYIPIETTVGFARFGATPTPFVIEVPTQEPY